jgi:hypothetical protein
MDWLNMLEEIFHVCIVPLLGILTTYAVKYIKAKSNQIIEDSESEKVDKYTAMLAQTITDCVIATKQTYVDALKKDGAFTKEAQAEAFKLTYNAVIEILTDDAKEYLVSAYGDLTVYLTNKIEAEVSKNK